MLTAILSNLPIIMIGLLVGFGGLLILNAEKRSKEKTKRKSKSD